MGPIPGLSWSDIGAIFSGFTIAAFLMALQWLIADAAPPGRTRRMARVILIALVIPALVVAIYRDWLAPSDWVRTAAATLWIGGTVLVRLAVAASQRPSVEQSVGTLSDERRPNELRQATAVNVLRQPSVDETSHPVSPSSPGVGRGRSGLLTVFLLAGLLIAPMAVTAVATQTPCEAVEVLIASGDPEELDLDPIAWVTQPTLPGYEVVRDGVMTLEDVVQSRVNPEPSRVELLRDGFTDAYERDWTSPDHGVGFRAQRFATAVGAVAWHAFANRFACQFANEVFRGPRGSIGMQIRYDGDPPIGEQVSWVSGRTRILISTGHNAPPPDHSRIESLAGLIQSE